MQRSGTERPGGRTARTEQAVHAAVRELIASGAPRPAVTAVAARAGVNAATIYRRWGSIDELLLDVAVKETNERRPVQAIGDLRADLTTYGRQVADDVSEPGGLGFLRAIIAVSSDPGSRPGTAFDLLQSRLDQFQALLDADTRPAALSVIDLIDGLLAPIYLRALLSSPATLTEDDLARLVDNLLAIDHHRRDALTPAETDTSRGRMAQCSVREAQDDGAARLGEDGRAHP